MKLKSVAIEDMLLHAIQKTLVACACLTDAEKIDIGRFCSSQTRLERAARLILDVMLKELEAGDPSRFEFSKLMSQLATLAHE